MRKKNNWGLGMLNQQDFYPLKLRALTRREALNQGWALNC